MISTVTKWFPDRGFGFIADPDNGRDLFCHFTDVIGREQLHPGDQVEFTTEAGAKGPIAVNVRPLTSPLSPRSP